jgi:hypothetical protein
LDVAADPSAIGSDTCSWRLGSEGNHDRTVERHQVVVGVLPLAIEGEVPDAVE